MADGQPRITEAQLRWASFHFKRQAVQVRAAVDQFYLQPPSVKDVEGAFSEDGNTSEESGSGGVTKKPQISRGRRALLRVSKRNVAKRRAAIEARGGYSACGSFAESDNDEDGTLETLFAEESFQKRRQQRRRRKHRNAKDADRVRRFESAFHFLMKNLEASQQHEQEIATPSRIWTRPEGAEGDMEVDYSALKLMGSQQKLHNPQLASQLPVDRGASWLIHMPERLSRHELHPSHHQGPIDLHHPEMSPDYSPARKRFKDIMTDFQHRVLLPGEVPAGDVDLPTMKLSKYFVPAALEDESPTSAVHDGAMGGDFVRARAAALQTTQDQLDSVFHSMDPALLKEMEELDPGVTERLRALYMGHDSPQKGKRANSGQRSSDGFVRKFVASMERAMQQEELLAADGRLQKAAFARLVNQYLLETTKIQSPMGSKGKSASSTRERVSALAERIVRKFSSDGAAAFLDSSGAFDKSAFETLVTRYLSEATGMDENAVLQAADLEELYGLSSSTVDEPRVQSLARQFAAEFTAEIMESYISVNNPVDTAQASAELEAISRNFLVEHCEVNSLGHRSDDATLQKAVRGLRDASLAAIRSAQTTTFHQDAFLTAVTSHLVDFFEAFTRPTKEVQEARQTLVRDLVSRIQQSASIEPLLTQQGTLDVPTVAKLLKRYLAAAQHSGGGSPMALAQVRRAAGSRKRGSEPEEAAPAASVTEEESQRFVERCIKSLRERARGEVLRCADGTVDEVRLGELLSSSFDPAFFQLEGELSCSFDPAFFQLEGEVPHRRNGDGPLKSESTPIAPGDSSANRSTSQVGSKIVNSVSKSLESFVRKLYKPEEDNDNDSDLKAYSAFRKSQDAQRDDESSQTSSFFPQRIKSAVENMGRSQRGVETGSSPSSARGSDISPKSGKLLSKKLMAQNDSSIIDTDGQDCESDTGNQAALSLQRIKHLHLSPALLTRRHRKAIRCIERRQWKEVQHLISANPWLAEMSDANTKQYLLHKLALYGAGEALPAAGGTYEAHGVAPHQINIDMVRMFPSSVHKFDHEGNLPLHMAAASANIPMTQLLGDRFPSGATVRNEDGLLPLHLALFACASPQTTGYGNVDVMADMIRTMLGYFPGSIAVTDNEGNLPIHTAASVLRGPVGVDAIFLLFDEAETQLKDPMGIRFRNKLKLEEIENMSIHTETTETPTDSSNVLEDSLQCTMVKNDADETPLLCAIHSCARWEVIDALLQGPCGRQSALAVDCDGNNALHLLLDEKYQDPTSALSVLKVVPEAACLRNNFGVLPIELACMYSLPLEVIIAIVLVDLPIDIDEKEAPKQRPGFGHSWWFIVCDCDDAYTEVVDEIVAICSVAQIRELTRMVNGAGDALMGHAAPAGKEILQCSLRFLGRFEIKFEMALPASAATDGVTLFQAVDFAEDPFDGVDVFLKFFPNRGMYDAETLAIRELEFEFTLVEEVFAFDTGELGEEVLDEESKQFVLCIEQPQITLAGVVSGMMRNDDCRNDPEVRQRYALKAFGVLRAVAKGLAHLHALGVVHGRLSADNVGKYDAHWKLAGMAGVQRIGRALDSTKFSFSIPPEAISGVERLGSSEGKTLLRHDLTVSPSIDIWGFGKLAYEVLVGRSLVPFDASREIEENHEALMDIMHWSEFSLKNAAADLLDAGVPRSGVELVIACLSPETHRRPSSAAVIEHDVWRELRRHKKSSSSP